MSLLSCMLITLSALAADLSSYYVQLNLPLPMYAWLDKSLLLQSAFL